MSTAVRFGSPGKDGILTKSLYVLIDAKPSPDSIKGGERVLYVKVSDPDGQPIMPFGPNVTEAPDGRHSSSSRRRESPATPT